MSKWIRTLSLAVLCVSIAGAVGWTAWNVNTDAGRWIAPATSAAVPGIAKSLEPVVREEVRTWLQERFETKIQESVNSQLKTEIETFAQGLLEDLAERLDNLTLGAEGYLNEAVPEPAVLDALITQIISEGLAERVSNMTVTTEDIWELLLLAAQSQATPVLTPKSTVTPAPTLKPTAKTAGR